VSQRHIDPRSRTESQGTEAIFRSESVRDVLTLLYKRRGLYWLVFFAFMGSLVWLSSQVEPIYKAKATVEFLARLESTMTENLDNPSMVRYRPMPPTDVNSQIELMKSREVIMGAIENPEVHLLPPFQNMPAWDNNETEKKISAWRNYLSTRFEINAIPNTAVANVTVSDWSPERAALLADRLAESFIRHRSRNFLAESNIEVYKKALVKITLRYEAASTKIENFRAENKVRTEPKTQLQRMLESRGRLLALLATARADLAALQTKKNNLKELADAGDPLLQALPEVSENTALKALATEVSETKNQLKELLKHNTQFHLPVRQLIEELSNREKAHGVALLAALNSIVFSATTLLSQKQAEEGALQGELASLDQEIGRLGSLETRWDRLTVEFESAREAYQLTKKHHDNAVTLSLTTPEFKAIVGAHAIVMTEPFFPPPEWMIWILAVLGGLFFGLSTVFVAGYLDRSLDTPGAAERELGLPVLATIQNERSSKKPRGRKKRR